MNTQKLLQNSNFRNNQNYILWKAEKKKLLDNLLESIKKFNYAKYTNLLEYDIWKIKLSYVKTNILKYKLIFFFIFLFNFFIFLFLLLKFNNIYSFILTIISLLLTIIYYIKIHNSETKKISSENYKIFIDNKYLYYSYKKYKVFFKDKYIYYSKK